MALSLTSLETNVYDAKPHCAAVNASVVAELATREAVQKQLQSVRDAESAASQALALVTDAAYVNTVKSSCGDLMTAASTVPPVVELSPASVVADNAMDAQVAAAAGSIDSVASAAAAATSDPAAAAAAVTDMASTLASSPAAQAAMTAAGVPSAEQLNNLAQAAETGSIEDLAYTAADMYIQQQTCGMLDAAAAENMAGILANGASEIGEIGLDALDTGIVPEIPATAQYGFLAGQTFESEDALKAAQLAAIDTTKANSLALAKQAGSCLADGIMTNLNNGTLTPDSLIANFDANMGALGSAIAGYVGAAVADVPGSNPCASQAVTDYALGCASLISTINKYANSANCLMSKATMLIDQAENIYRHGPEILIAMAETTAQTAANTAIMALRNAAATNCNIGLAVNVVQNTITSVQSTAKAGMTVLNTAKDLQGSIGNMVNTCKHTDDIIEKGKWLVNEHPVVRAANSILKDGTCDVKTFKSLSKTGTKYARACLGTEKQNQLTSIEHATTRSSKTYSCDRAIKSTLKKDKYTTTTRKNRYNLYDMISYSI